MWGRWGTPQNYLLAFIHELWKARKIGLLKKWKNLLNIPSFYICVPKTTIIWGTVPEIRSEREFLSFWAIFCPLNLLPPNNPENQNSEEMKKAFVDVIILNLCNKKHDHMMYAYSEMEFSHRQFFVISCYFLLFCPTIDREN